MGASQSYNRTYPLDNARHRRSLGPQSGALHALCLLASTRRALCNTTLNAGSRRDKHNQSSVTWSGAQTEGCATSFTREAGVPEASVVLEARGLRAADRSRPGDVVALDFFANGRHLVIDAVLTTVYRNTVVLEKVATVPGYAAKQAEDKKFLADRTSTQPISGIHGGPHILVPFALEDGGRLGAHAHALLRALAT